MRLDSKRIYIRGLEIDDLNSLLEPVQKGLR